MQYPAFETGLSDLPANLYAGLGKARCTRRYKDDRWLRSGFNSRTPKPFSLFCLVRAVGFNTAFVNERLPLYTTRSDGLGRDRSFEDFYVENCTTVLDDSFSRTRERLRGRLPEVNLAPARELAVPVVNDGVNDEVRVTLSSESRQVGTNNVQTYQGGIETVLLR